MAAPYTEAPQTKNGVPGLVGTLAADGSALLIGATDNGDGTGTLLVSGGGGGGGGAVTAPLGQTTMAGSVAVAIASNQSAVPISAASLPLPTGAATAANQPALGQAAMASSLPVAIASNQSAVPVSAASLPLPTGAATAANQPALGQAAMAASLPVAIASNQSALSTIPAGNVASGAADSGNPVKTGGKYNATLPTLADGNRGDVQLDSRGLLLTDLGVKLDATNDAIQAWLYDGAGSSVTKGQKAAASSLPVTPSADVTYSGSVIGLVAAAAATDVLTLTGSAGKTLRVTRIQISGQATAASDVDFVLLKRSTANTGGTSGAVTAVPHDSASAAASGTALSYTANPTTGTLVGNLRAAKATVTTGAGAIPNVAVLWTFGERGEQPITLRGTGEVLAVNLNGQTVTGLALDIDITWTES